MKKTFFITTIVLVATFVVFTASVLAQAATPYTSKDLPFDPQKGSIALSPITLLTLGQRDPVTVTIALINITLTLLGLGFLVLLLYAGFIWIWARGNEEEIGKAKTVIIRSVGGLIIILATYGISNLVFFLVNTYATKK